jgi:type IV pilus assembly protein PilC
MGLLMLPERLLRMTAFAYTAIEAATGRKTTGILESAGKEAAIAELRTRGLCPTRVAEIAAEDAIAGGKAGAKSPLAAAKTHARLGKTVGRKERMIFTRQLAALVGAGMPLVRALDLLARQEKNLQWREVIASLVEVITSGGTLARGMTNHPRIFDRLYLGMVTAGESGGRLEVVLERLARHLENSGRIESRVRAAMTYPIVVMVVAAAIVTALMTFVVPRFEKIFLTMLKGAPLPRLTSGVLGASRFVQNHWWWLLGSAALAWAGVRWMLKREACARAFDRLLLRLPMLGDLVLKTAVARFSRTLGTMLTSGVPMLQALHLARDSCGNRHLAESIDDVRRRVREGESVAQPLEASGVFPVVVAGMVEVGEETGTLPAMLHHIADMYDEEVEHGVTSLTSLIEPLMIVLMALVVGAIVIALFLPIVRIIQLMT